jgi:hypothetical protein
MQLPVRRSRASDEIALGPPINGKCKSGAFDMIKLRAILQISLLCWNELRFAPRNIDISEHDNDRLQSASVSVQDNFRGGFSADVLPESPGGRLALLQKINPIPDLGGAVFYSKKRLNPNKT